MLPESVVFVIVEKNALSIFRKSTENWQRAQAIFASLAKWILSSKEQVHFADEAKTFVVSVSSFSVSFSDMLRDKSSLIFAGVLPLQIDIGFSLVLVFT